MNIPNKLTLFRIFLIPFFVIVLQLGHSWGEWQIAESVIPIRFLIAAIIFAVASITDYLDGAIARKYGLITTFGKFADPMADKLLVVTAFIALVEAQLVPSWVASIIVCRELAVTGLRILLVSDGEVLAAALPGKIKTATQMVAILFFLLDDIGFKAFHIPFANGMLYCCLIFTIYSGVDYFVKNKHVFIER